MADTPPLIVIHGATGERREYTVENEVDLDNSFDCIDAHFKWLERARNNQNKARHEEHIRLMQAKTLEYVDTPEYQLSYGSVFLLMLSTAKYGGRVPLTNRQIEEKLKCSRQTVSRAIKHLINNGMLIVGEHEGRDHYFLPSPAAEKGRSEIIGTEKMAKEIKQRVADDKALLRLKMKQANMSVV